MKLNKTFGRIATTLVATAMLASVAAVPAFAAEGEFTSNEIKMTKNLEMPADSVVPGATFKFDIVTAQLDGEEKYTDDNDTPENPLDDVTLDVKLGTATKNDAGTATITAGQETTTVGAGVGNKIASVEFSLTLPEEKYSEAGVYKYAIDEQAVNTDAGFSDQTGSLNLYLIVTRVDTGSITDDEDFQVSGAIIEKADGTKTATWTNYYKLDDSGKSEVGSISVKKEIAGAMGNKGDTFEFTTNGLTDGVTYTYTTSDAPATEKTMTSTNNKVTLGHNQTMTLVGLDDGAEITVTETIPANSGYATTAITNDNDEDLTNGNTLTVAKNQVKDTTFTNTRNVVSPTGLVMDIAPYVLLVVAAAVGCFVFLRKRRED